MTFLCGSPLQEGTGDWGLLANIMTPGFGDVFLQTPGKIVHEWILGTPKSFWWFCKMDGWMFGEFLTILIWQQIWGSHHPIETTNKNWLEKEYQG